MTPETVGKIARRIGMTSPVKVGIHCQWVDNNIVAAYGHHDLCTYLATGDRPLRLLATFPDPGLSKTTDGLNWWCEANTDFPGTQGIGATPTLAIIACAAALEEGR